MYDVIITPAVEDQLRDTTTYIAYELYDPDAADRLVDKFEEALNELEKFPKGFAPVEDEPWHSIPIRLCMVNSYCLYFWVKEDAKEVYLTLWIHEKRDRDNALYDMDHVWE